MINWFNKLVTTGVRPKYQPWEIYLTRKLNLLACITMCNMVLALVFFPIIGFYDILIDCFLSLLVLPLIILLNHFKNYIWTAYGFYIIGFSFLASMALKMGIGSYIILFYFPMMISMIQLLGRKEMLKHLVVISVFCFMTIIVIVVGYTGSIYNFDIANSALKDTKLFNIILSFLSALAFNITIVME